MRVWAAPTKNGVSILCHCLFFSILEKRKRTLDFVFFHFYLLRSRQVIEW